LRNFRSGKPLQEAKKNYHSQAFPEIGDCLKDSGAAFRFGEGLFGCRPLIPGIENKSRFGVIRTSFERRVGSPLTNQHQRFIDSYARYPGSKGRISAESREVG